MLSAFFARLRLAPFFLVLAMPDPAVLRAKLDEVLGRVEVTSPGTVFAAPRRVGFRLAAVAGVEPPALPAVIAPEGEDGSDRRVEPATWYLMTAVSRHLAGGGDGVQALAALADWAEAGALERLEPAGPGRALTRSRYTLKRALLPLIAGYAVLRRDLDPPVPTRQLVEGWLGRLTDLASPLDGPITARNNHRYMRDAVLIAWGALSGDSARFRDGIAGSLDAIAAMRGDGAWPLEIERGRRALWYQRHALASLTAVAEICAMQGFDLWSVEIEGRSLHRAVGWLLDALAAEPADQDLGFLVRRGNGRHYMAWAVAYLARFPGRPEVLRLAGLLAAAPRPLVDDYSGGDVSALLGLPAGAAGRGA